MSKDKGNDRWLRDLGRVVREDIEAKDLRQLDRRWDAYAAESLTPEQQTALLDEAQESPEGQRAMGLFRPLDEDFKKKLARQTLSQVRAEAPSGLSGESRKKSRLLEWLLGHTGMSWNLRLATAVAAVGIITLVGWRLLTGAGALPAYTVDVEPMTSETRSGAEAILDGARLWIRLRPQTATTIQPEIRIYVGREGRVERWTAAEEKIDRPVPDGAIFVETPAWEWGPGEWTLFVVLGRRGSLPPDREARAILDRGTPETAEWQVLKEKIAVEPSLAP